MKRLKKEFKSCGFYFKQLKRVDNIAIYEKTLIKPVCDRSSYEVIRISSHNGYKLGGSYIDPAETYPSNSMWGTHGFTADTLANAEKQFDKMQGRPDNPGSVQMVIKRKPTNGSVQPHLTCIISGNCRPTTLKYLQTKADKLNVSVSVVQENYISKSALSLLTAGHDVDTAREMLGAVINTPVSDDRLYQAMLLNGRNKKPAVTI